MQSAKKIRWPLTTIKGYTPEQVAARVEELKRDLLSSGWDDVVHYNYEVSATSVEDLLSKILDQPHVISPDPSEGSSTYPTKKPVGRTGNGVSFGGWLRTPAPYLLRIIGSIGIVPDPAELQKAEALLLGTLMTKGEAAAEAQAEELYLQFPEGLVKDVRRGFLRVLVPVQYVV